MVEDKYIIVKRRRREDGSYELSKLDYAKSVMNADIMCMHALDNDSYDVASGDILLVMDINHVSDFIARSRVMYVVDNGKIIRPDQPNIANAKSWLEVWESPDYDVFYMISVCCLESSSKYIERRRVGQACVACVKTLHKIYDRNISLSSAVDVLELWSEGKLELDDVIRVRNKFRSTNDSQFVLGILQLCDYAIYGGEFAATDSLLRFENCLAMYTNKYDKYYMARVIREAVPLERLFMAVSPHE